MRYHLDHEHHGVFPLDVGAEHDKRPFQGGTHQTWLNKPAPRLARRESNWCSRWVLRSGFVHFGFLNYLLRHVNPHFDWLSGFDEEP